MKRRPLNRLAVLSLLLCVAVVAIWVRSHHHYADVEWGTSYETGFGWRLYDHSLAASDGAVYYVRSYPPLVSLGPSGPWARHYELFGFHFSRGTQGLVPDSGLAAYRCVVGVPFWLFAGAFAVLPATRIARGLRRHRPGVCRKCGYDLRATPDRCPECGTIAPVPPPE